MLNQKDSQEAYRLWKGFRTETTAYRKLAEKYKLSVGELNTLCQKMDQGKKQAEGKRS